MWSSCTRWPRCWGIDTSGGGHCRFGEVANRPAWQGGIVHATSGASGPSRRRTFRTSSPGTGADTEQSHGPPSHHKQACRDEMQITLRLRRELVAARFRVLQPNRPRAVLDASPQSGRYRRLVACRQAATDLSMGRETGDHLRLSCPSALLTARGFASHAMPRPRVVPSMSGYIGATTPLHWRLSQMPAE